MRKKNVLFASGIILAVLFGLEYVGTYALCDFIISNGHEGNCPFVLSDIEIILSPILALFIFSLITYKMRDEIFQSWWRFARVWVPLSMIVTFFTPSYTHNWMFPIVKANVALLLSAIFIIVSFIKITQAYRSKK